MTEEKTIYSFGTIRTKFLFVSSEVPLVLSVFGARNLTTGALQSHKCDNILRLPKFLPRYIFFLTQKSAQPVDWHSGYNKIHEQSHNHTSLSTELSPS
jgi:hypothetical protein